MNKNIIITTLAMLLCLGIATAELYQETGDSYGYGPIESLSNYFFVNYTIPIGATREGTLWQIRHGTLAAYNITIPYDCWNNPLQLGLKTQAGGGMSWSQPVCWNGASWQLIGTQDYYAGSGTSSGGDAFIYTYDGDWESYADSRFYSPYWTGSQAGCGGVKQMYEEGIYWDIECINDTDCGTCQYCNAGICENQTHTDLKADCGSCQYCDGAGSCMNEYYTDIKNDCGFCQICCGNPRDGCSPGECVNQHNGEDLKGVCQTGVVCMAGPNIWVYPGGCDGWGDCHPGWLDFITQGHVCINDTAYDVPPTADVHCGIWSNCIARNISANEYYVGYCDVDVCCDPDWVPAGTTWNATPDYLISVTEHTDTCQEAQMCVVDTDCGTCQYCNAGICDNEPSHTDIKGDCDYLDICLDYATWNDGFCSGSGICNAASHLVSYGNVCINSSVEFRDTAPTTDVHCGVWSDCLLHNTSAPEYYVGYADNIYFNCAKNDNWTTTGTYQTATSGYWWNATEQVDTCQEELIPIHHGGGGTFLETTTPEKPATFALVVPTGGEIRNPFIDLWNIIKTFLRSIGVNI